MTEMDITKHFYKTKIPILHFMFLLLLYSFLFVPGSEGFGFDSANSCGPNGKISRRGRAQILAAIPCDFSQQAYCEKAGHAYPWHAVRRFVHENQGLMKRMYGDVLHISVLRDEIQNNDIEDEDIEITAARYSPDGQRRSSKFMHEPEDYTSTDGAKNNVLAEPHFRPLAGTPATTMVEAKQETKTAVNVNDFNTTSDIPLINSDRKSTRRNKPGEGTRYRPYYNPRRRNRTTTTTTTKAITTTTEAPEKLNSSTAKIPAIKKADPVLETTVMEAIKLLNTDGGEKILLATTDEYNDDSNLHSNSVYEIPQNSIGENIKIVTSPQLNGGSLQNLTQQLSTISSTLKVASTLKPQHFYTRRRPIISQQQHQIYKISSNVVKESALNAKVQSKESKRTSSIQQPSSNTKTTTTTTTETPTTILVKGANDNNSSIINFTNVAEKTTITTKTIPVIHQSANEQTSTTTTTSSTVTNAKTTNISTAPSMLPLRVNGELLSNNKQRKPTSTPAVIESTTSHAAFHSSTLQNTMTTKPVLRDGQLFQDTLKQESSAPAPSASTTNLRGINACPVKEEVVAPFWANNTRGEILALLNMYPFEQYVHWEKCTHEHKQMYCREGCRCEQQYRLHRLLAYDPHNECRGIFSDWFRFPSCCLCKCFVNIPTDFRATSRSPRAEHMGIIDDDDSNIQDTTDQRHPIERAEEQVKKAIYEHATEDWYRPADEHATEDWYRPPDEYEYAGG